MNFKFIKIVLIFSKIFINSKKFYRILLKNTVMKIVIIMFFIFLLIKNLKKKIKKKTAYLKKYHEIFDFLYHKLFVKFNTFTEYKIWIC